MYVSPVGDSTRGGPLEDVVRFDEPPVRSVQLCLYFDEVTALKTSHLSSLREIWRDDYPVADELSPLPPRRSDATSRIIESDDWPMPYTSFTSEDSGAGLAIQGDRFCRTWSFTGDQYPGFDALLDDLAGKWSQFVDVVAREVGSRVKIVGASCLYANEFSGLQPGELSLGVLSSWTAPFSPTTRARYQGARLHYCDDPDLDGCAITISVDEQASDTPTLTLFVEVDAEENPHKDSSEGASLLRRAHSQLIRSFLSRTNAEQHQRWGRS
jgi:uncharacterized protein (TIGR04255 family)